MFFPAIPCGQDRNVRRLQAVKSNIVPWDFPGTVRRMNSNVATEIGALLPDVFLGQRVAVMQRLATVTHLNIIS